MRELINKHLTNETLKKACEELLNYPEFLEWPASLGHHHAYDGGLLVHTREVVDYCLQISKINFKKSPDKEILVAAALWHDLAKIWDYSFVKGCSPPADYKYSLAKQEGLFIEGYWVQSEYQNRIHHINGSCAEFTSAAMLHRVDRKTIQRVQHAILAHHGPNRDWGSPVKPISVEALVLHQADNLSALCGRTS